MKNLRHNFFAQFAVLSLGTLAIFATVIGFVLNAEDAEYIELFQKHFEMMETGAPIEPDSDYSVPSILEHFENQQQNDIIAVSAGFIVLYVALILIVWVGWKNSRQDDRDLQIANENLVSSDASIRKMADERAAVAELGRIATSAPDMRDIYEIFASRVGSLVPFSMLSINLVDEETQTFTTRYVTGENTSHHLQGNDMPIAGTFVEPLQNGRSGDIVKSGV